MTNQYLLMAVLIAILVILALIVGDNHSNLNVNDTAIEMPKSGGILQPEVIGDSSAKN